MFVCVGGLTYCPPPTPPQVTEPALRDLEARIRSINRMATMTRSQRAVVPVDYVLGVGGFDLQAVEEQVGRGVCGGGAAAAAVQVAVPHHVRSIAMGRTMSVLVIYGNIK